MKPNIITLCLLISLYSCKTVTNEEKVTVTYYTGIRETNIRITCNNIKEKSCNHKVDTVINITSEEFDKIQRAIRLYQNKKADCDARLYINTDTLEMCLGSLSADLICGFDNEDIGLDILHIFYQIKCRSGYYNYIPKDDLEYDYYIEKFGIPKNYKYIYDNVADIKVEGVVNNMYRERKIVKKGLVKVLFKVKEH